MSVIKAESVIYVYIVKKVKCGWNARCHNTLGHFLVSQYNKYPLKMGIRLEL